MISPGRILVFHTAFLGDLILTLPLFQLLRDRFPGARRTAVVVPAAAGVIRAHPAVDDVIEYDKKGSERGIRGAVRLGRRLKAERFDIAIVPHRSARSAAIIHFSGARRTIGFATSAGSALFTDSVPYQPHIHEIDRNLSLLGPLGIQSPSGLLPIIHVPVEDRRVVDEILASSPLARKDFITVAPGSVWMTKRWPQEQFVRLLQLMTGAGMAVALVGGAADEQLCGEILRAVSERDVLNGAGRLSVLQSAELIRRSRLLISNDSAPMHLAVGVGTPVAAIFGATVPAFGFAPRGPRDVILEIGGLACRPCAIHGGNHCPIGTLECMRAITPERVFHTIRSMLDAAHPSDRPGHS